MATDGRLTLAFSESFLRAEYRKHSDSFRIVIPTIVLNIGDCPLEIAGTSLHPWQSTIYSNVILRPTSSVLCITLGCGFFASQAFPYAEALMSSWPRASDVLSVSALRSVPLWRSEKHAVAGIEFNLWFATSGTGCGIHKTHNFREVHTQIFGIGCMQKFHSQDPATTYQEVFMSPGYTHEPFYSDDREYPWHQYHAYTDCIWLAAERG